MCGGWVELVGARTRSPVDWARLLVVCAFELVALTSWMEQGCMSKIVIFKFGQLRAQDGVFAGGLCKIVRADAGFCMVLLWWNAGETW